MFLNVPKASKMDVEKKTFTYDCEEVTITASENWFKNFANDIIEGYKIGLAKNIHSEKRISMF